MRLSELLEVIGIENDTDTEITGLCTDNRKVKKGDLFFCIKGLRFDPHEYVGEISAAAVIIEHDTEDASVPLIRVASARVALAKIAAKFYGIDRLNLPFVGITGTNGKTSTAYFIEHILKYNKVNAGVIGTVGVAIGDRPLDARFATSTTPDTIDFMEIIKRLKEENADAVVVEVTSHALALHKLDGIFFRVGVFTNLTQDHLDFHRDMEEYFEAKARLFGMCESSVINIDDSYGVRIAKNGNSKIMTYGTSDSADLRAENPRYFSNSVEYDLNYAGKKIHLRVPIAGRFTVYNSLAAIGAAFSLGIPLSVITSAIADMPPVRGRIQSIPNDKGFSVIVDYSHTPDSLSNIITSVREYTKGEIITVFGCGGDRDKTKRPIMGKIASSLSDYCVLTSDNPRSEDPTGIINEIEAGMVNKEYSKQPDRKLAITDAIERAKQGDAVIIAGKGHETYQEFRDKTIDFDDAAVAAEILASL